MTVELSTFALAAKPTAILFLPNAIPDPGPITTEASAYACAPCPSATDEVPNARVKRPPMATESDPPVA